MLEFGDYIFIESDNKTVVLAELFKTLPVQYEKLRKNYSVIGRASKLSLLIGAGMDPELTIVLEKKLKTILAAGVSRSDLSTVATLRSSVGK